MPDMKRREFITLLGGGSLLLAAKVKRARGQQAAMPVIGFLSGGLPGPYAPFAAAYHRGLKETGYVEDVNTAIAEKPDLVLWQLGTNSLLRDEALLPNASLVREGLARIKATGRRSC